MFNLSVLLPTVHAFHSVRIEALNCYHTPHVLSSFYLYFNQIEWVQGHRWWNTVCFHSTFFFFFWTFPHLLCRIFSLLSAILHLGNICYKRKTYRDDSIDICNPEVLPVVSELLEVEWKKTMLQGFTALLCGWMFSLIVSQSTWCPCSYYNKRINK